MQKPLIAENGKAGLPALAGSEIGRYILEKDWSKTQMGPVENWPQTFRTTLRLLLHTKLPAILFWGKDCCCLYNDAYHTRFGHNKPHEALGQPVKEVWPDGWQALAPQVESVMRSGEGILHENSASPFFNNGQREDVHLTYNMAPVYDETAPSPAGVLVTFTETITKAVQGENRFSRLVKEAPVGIVVVTGEEMKVEVSNAAFGRIIDRIEEVLEGRQLFDIIPDAEAVYRPILEKVRISGEPHFLYGQPYVVYKGNERIKGFLNVVCQPCKDPDGITPGVMVLCHDVTEQTIALKRAKESEEKLRMALEGGELGTFDFYLEEGKMHWSAKTKELFGLPPETAESFDLFAQALHPDDRQKSIAAADKAMRPESGGVYENTYRTVGITDGKMRWVRSKGRTSFDEDGKPIRFSGVMQDVTQQKEAEERLRIAQKQLELTIENVPAAVYLFDNKANILYLNKQGRRHMQTLLGKDYVPAENLEALLQKTSGKMRYTDTDGVPMENDRYPMSVVLKTGNEATLMMRRIYNDSGREEWFINNATPLLDEDGKVQFILSTATDYTEQKEIEQKLRESEARFRSLANAMPQIVWVAESNGEVTYYNDRVQAFDGITKLPDGNWAWQGMVHPDDIEPTAEAWQWSVETKTPYEKEHRIRMKDAMYRWHLSRALPELDAAGNVVKWYGTATDIHDQKLTEQAVKESGNRFRSLIEQAPVATCLFVGRQLRIEIANEKMLAYMGKGRSVLGHPLAEALPELKGQPFLSLLDKIFLTGEEHEAWAVPATLVVNGVEQTNYFDYTFKPLRNAEGKVYAIIDMSVDVTDQVKSLLQLRESESRFRTLAETLPQMIWVSGKEGNAEYFSSQWKVYTGMDNPFEAWENMTHPDDKQLSTQAYRKAFAEGVPFRSEVRLKNKANEYRWHSSIAEPVKDSAGNIVKWVGALTDIHDQKTIAEKLEKIVAERTKELQRSNEDLQQFAHVASHDLKEPVRKVRTFSGRLREELGSSVTTQEHTYLSKIEGAADRMYSMIDGVLAYSSLNAMEQTKEQVNLNDVLYDVGVDLEVLMEQKKATLDYADLPTIEGVAVLLHQLFYNLVNNSLKFARTGVPSYITIRSKTEEDQVTITVQDNGIGFDQKQSKHIFQTFSRLNSKDRYEGTGLGLSLCKKIAERHGGSITARGKDGEGACFEIVLPVNGVPES